MLMNIARFGNMALEIYSHTGIDCNLFANISLTKNTAISMTHAISNAYVGMRKYFKAKYDNGRVIRSMILTLVVYHFTLPEDCTA